MINIAATGNKFDSARNKVHIEQLGEGEKKQRNICFLSDRRQKTGSEWEKNKHRVELNQEF